MEPIVSEYIEVIPTSIQVVLILSFSFVAAKIIESVGYYALHQSKRLATGEYDRIIIEELHIPLYVTVFLVGVYASAQLLPEVGIGFYIASTAMSIILVLWSYATIRVGGRIIGASNNAPTDREITPIIKNVLTFFVILAGFSLLLGIWNVNITPFLASAGIIGIVLGIAAQDSLGNFFSGISLYLDKTYKLGDVIQLESGERGTVIDMSIRSTTILTRDNISITVPNSELNSKQVINESSPVRRRRIRLDVGVAYGSSLQQVKKALLEIAEQEDLILKAPAPAVRFREFEDSAIVAQLQCHIEHPALRGRARHSLIERIDERFREEEIKIPFPQREVSFYESGNTVRFEETTEQVSFYDPESEGTAERNNDD
ncbi:mechanosensitive ion channel family protein [Halorubrum tibetense]|uniref:Mechanosensitive ion channel family protein n=1 Tax=Halorubrum tibetense TaxID=175631 RepID=A0ABD5S7E0_9EURY